MNEYPQWTDNAITVLNRRYLKKDADGNPAETPEDMLWRVAQDIAEAERNYEVPAMAGDISMDNHVHTTALDFYRMMRGHLFLANSPALMNAGRDLQQLSACFVLPVGDSMDSIFQTLKDTALIHKSGGGTGFDFSRLRPKGDLVGSTGGVASGPVSFMQVYDQATEHVKQGGTRRGANMASMFVTHPDIYDFIEVKRDGSLMQNFNLSVGVSDEFMRRALSDSDEMWQLINPRTGEVSSVSYARYLLDEIVQNAWETGDPGLIFFDTVNSNHPNPERGRITGTNPCSESFMLPNESCNLGSINLGRMVEGKLANYGLIRKTVRTAVRFLDNVIDRTQFPTPDIGNHSRMTRRIGLGVMGFADMLVQMDIPYDSETALYLANDVMDLIQSTAYEASSLLAEERGCYPAWECSTYNLVNDRKMRNTSPTVIAPTGTISIIAGASSGIEPLFALAYERRVMDNDRLPEYYQPFMDELEGLGLPVEKVNAVKLKVLETGSCQSCLELPESFRRKYRVSHDIAPRNHVLMQAAWQKFTDNGISKTVNLPHDATPKDVFDIYKLAWESGCKSITVYRDGSKESQVLNLGGASKEPAHIWQGMLDTTQTFTKSVSAVVTAEAERTAAPSVKERPRTMRGETTCIETGHGRHYLTVNRDDSGQPFEVFASGSKAGGCNDAMSQAVTRLASLALRSGVPASQVIDQLRNITCCVTFDNGRKVGSLPDAIAIALEESLPADFVPRQPRQKLECPDCGSEAWLEEGCAHCPACGWSKC